ncbi:MAG: ComF family protein [Alphaproteobacteria bacterium]|nr:ComF family protein [Alphaproteobacteria bacterium]
MKITRKFLYFISTTCKNIIDFAFPHVCLCCDNTIEKEKIFCDKCFSKIIFIQGSICYRCGKKVSLLPTEEKILCSNCLKKRPIYDKARAVFQYNAVSKNAILKFKNTGKIEYAHPFVFLLQQAGKDLFLETDLIIPVPMHWKRKLSRGYNQAGILAQILSKKTKIPYNENILIRARHTPKQEKKTKAERIKNVKNAFVVNHPEKIKNKSILIIDDVLTTGATVNNCAKELKKAGARAVFVLTIAQTAHED